VHDLATVLLRHTLTTGCHYDWLLEDPAAPPGRGLLVAVRIPRPSEHWHAATTAATAAAVTMLAVALPPHRRRYLHYQGPLTDRRGHVVRVDAGRCRPLLWTDHRRVLAVTTPRFQGRVNWTRLTADRWQLAFTGAADPACRITAATPWTRDAPRVS
jgi:hypothetical protein